MPDDYGTNVEVRSPISGGYRLKVSIESLGMYIDGFTARESDRNTSGYWIQPPAQQKNGKWVQTPEFNKQTDFWRQLEEKCLEAIADCKPSSKQDLVHEPTDEQMDEPINLDALPF